MFSVITALFSLSFFANTSFAGGNHSSNILGFKFSLNECELSYEINNVPKIEKLTLQDHCQFHKDKNSNIRVEHIHGKQVILVERSVPHPKANADDFFKDKCETQLMGIVIDNGLVTVRKNKVKILGCSGLMWDRKVFSSFAK